MALCGVHAWAERLQHGLVRGKTSGSVGERDKSKCEIEGIRRSRATE